ncbi:MAG: GDSL-type esterase/lipase family protein [Vitreoscilla sp.]
MSLFAQAGSPQVDMVASWPVDSTALVARPVGRVERLPGEAGWRYQWPGTYFEARFSGAKVYVDLGSGEKHARVWVDSREVADLLRPGMRTLRVRGLGPGEHRVRVDIVSESRDGVQDFGGFAVPDPADALAPRPRARAIEFIGDSYTVGYGAASNGRTCGEDEVWRTTDNSLAFGPQVARHFDADYRVMALSGRGMVRNYANAAGQTLPAAYARQLPDGAQAGPASDESDWTPQLIVVGLGTNDFSTPVAAGEPWKDADALSAAFEARYVDFVQSLHARHPAARFLLLASDAGDGAAEQAIRRVREQLVARGMPVAEVFALGQLALEACDWHPSRADHEMIARRLAVAIEAFLPAWRQAAD